MRFLEGFIRIQKRRASQNSKLPNKEFSFQLTLAAVSSSRDVDMVKVVTHNLLETEVIMA